MNARPTESNWWLARQDWPDLGPDTYEIEQAIALMLLEEYLVLLNAKGVAGIFVNCGDTFGYGCADAEPLPTVGFDDDLPVWELYDLARKHGARGTILWCCRRRKQRPIPEVEAILREAECWSDDLDLLPIWPGTKHD